MLRFSALPKRQMHGNGAIDDTEHLTHDRRAGGEVEREAFAAGAWGQRFPTVVAAWRRAWTNVIPCFAFPPEVRRMIYTTNAIESVNARLRKIIKTRGHFPTDDAASKLIWLALRNITADWNRATHNWKAAMNQFAILYEDRFTRPPVWDVIHTDLSTRLTHRIQDTPHSALLTKPFCLQPRKKNGTQCAPLL